MVCTLLKKSSCNNAVIFGYCITGWLSLCPSSTTTYYNCHIPNYHFAKIQQIHMNSTYYLTAPPIYTHAPPLLDLFCIWSQYWFLVWFPQPNNLLHLTPLYRWLPVYHSVFACENTKTFELAVTHRINCVSL